MPFFLSYWYNSTWDWTPVSQKSGEHSYHYAFWILQYKGIANNFSLKVNYVSINYKNVMKKKEILIHY